MDEPSRMRIDYAQVAPGAYEAILGLEKYLARERFDRRLLHLVKYRASLLNGCAHCLEMHAKEAVAEGEDPVRLYTLAAWEETPLFTPKERAALRWTEAVTQVYEDHVPDAVYEEARKYFGDKELVDLTMAVIAINAWNRLAIPFRSPVGNYVPKAAKSEAAPRPGTAPEARGT